MKEKYDRIGKFYNRTRTADPYLTEKFFQFLTPPREGKFLDIGCGTGNYTKALGENGLDFIGVDPSIEMLNKAKAKSHNIEWKVGRSEEIPLENETLEGVLASLTIHHWADLQAAFSELKRVLKSSGKFVIFTSIPVQMNGYWLNHYFPEMIKVSAKQMHLFETVENALNESGFQIETTEKYFVKKDLRDLFLYSGKHCPEIYLKPQVRAGISSFSDLANSKEVAAGLKNIEIDIKSGEIYRIIKRFENDAGDYLFIITSKI